MLQLNVVEMAQSRHGRWRGVGLATLSSSVAVACVNRATRLEEKRKLVSGERQVTLTTLNQPIN